MNVEMEILKKKITQIWVEPVFSNTETMATVTLKEREWCLKCKIAIYISANLSVDLTQLVGKAGCNEL